MPLVPLGSLPDDARVWVFAAERALAPAEAEAVLGTVDAFLGVWAAHGRPLRSARDLRESRFLIIAVDEASAGASGCSIDALVREIRALEAELGVTLVDHGPIVFQESLEVRDDDVWDTLEPRVHEIEHRLLPAAVRALVEGRLKIEDRRVHVLEAPEGP